MHASHSKCSMALAGTGKEKNWLINKHGEKYQTFTGRQSRYNLKDSNADIYDPIF